MHLTCTLSLSLSPSLQPTAITMVLSNGTSWSKPMRFCRGFCNFTLCLYKTVAPKAVEHKRPSSLPGVLVPASAVVTHRRHDRRPGPRPVESKRARYSDAPVGRFKMFQVSNKQNVGFEVCGHAQIWDAAWSEGLAHSFCCAAPPD